MRVLLYAKMLKETKTEETTVFFVTFFYFLSLIAFQLGGAGPLVPPGYAYADGFDSVFRPFSHTKILIVN